MMENLTCVVLLMDIDLHHMHSVCGWNERDQCHGEALPDGESVTQQGPFRVTPTNECDVNFKNHSSYTSMYTKLTGHWTAILPFTWRIELGLQGNLHGRYLRFFLCCCCWRGAGGGFTVDL